MPKLALQSRLLWLFVLVGHAIGAVGWMWLMPHGFPVAHRRFWANEVVPAALLLAVAVALWSARWERFAVVRVTLLALAVMWGAAAVSGQVIFPISTQLRWLAPLGLAAAICIAAFGPRLRDVRWPKVANPMAVSLGAWFGAALPWLQRAPDPSTRPLNVNAAWPDVAPTSAPSEHPRTRRSGIALLQPNDGQLTIASGPYVLYVQPLLSFVSRSPDRCWTSLAPRDLRLGPRRRLMADDGTLHYEDDGRSMLSVEGDDRRVTIDARSDLPQPVFSHLNSFCELQVAGHRNLAVSFSPCPDARIDVLPSDYPIGRPTRCAYLGADGVFRVVEATSGEKGPFRELAKGPLARTDPLTITLHDDGWPFCTITLDDFAAQASTDLSPTAGWGLPMNAIEFSLSGERATSPASIFVTLAGTSVGRGWDSVGHAAGTYRNRVTIEFDLAAKDAKNAKDRGAKQRALKPSLGVLGG